MDLSSNPALEPFRADVRKFFETDYPQDIRAKVATGASLTTAEVRKSEMALGAKGWLASAWPKEYGGPGWSLEEQYIFDEELERAGVPTVTPMGVIYVGPILYTFGSQAQKDKWLPGTRDGSLGWAQGYSEPDSGSDLASLQFSAKRDGDEYVLNGEKYWASGAGDPRCAVYIVMVRTGDEDAPKHRGHSMIVVDAKTPGIEILRPMMVFGHDDAPHGHMHIRFKDVRVPAENLLLGEGRGFEIAQGRLGPGRIHHCMRSVGQAEAALELLCQRSLRKEAFGKPLAQLGANFDIIAECRMEIEMARLLCLKAAWMMDQGDARAAAPWISQIKVVAPRMALKVLDEAMQMHGGQGISQDTPLAMAWTWQRALRFADGPDAVHRRQVARAELRKHTQEKI